MLTGNGVTRRVPYSFLIERPALRDVTAVKLKKTQIGDTRSRLEPRLGLLLPVRAVRAAAELHRRADERGRREHLYSAEIDQPVVNFGVSVLAATTGALIDPFVLGSKDENDVQGYAGIPTDVNPLTFDGGLDIGAAGAQFPRLQRFYVAVDSRADEYTNKSQKGKYLLNAWTNDLTPPTVHVLTTRVTAGRPLIVAEACRHAVRRRPALARARRTGRC